MLRGRSVTNSPDEIDGSLCYRRPVVQPSLTGPANATSVGSQLPVGHCIETDRIVASWQP